MKQETYSAKQNDGFVFTAIDNTSISDLLQAAKEANKVVICNKSCVIVLHMGSENLYFNCLSEVTFTTVENALLKPYTKIYGNKLSVGRNDDTDITVKSHETVLYNYSARLAKVK